MNSSGENNITTEHSTSLKQTINQRLLQSTPSKEERKETTSLKSLEPLRGHSSNSGITLKNSQGKELIFESVSDLIDWEQLFIHLDLDDCIIFTMYL